MILNSEYSQRFLGGHVRHAAADSPVETVGREGFHVRQRKGSEPQKLPRHLLLGRHGQGYTNIHPYSFFDYSTRALSSSIIHVIPKHVHRLRHPNNREKPIGKLNRDLINQFWQNKIQSQFGDPTIRFERLWSQVKQDGNV